MKIMTLMIQQFDNHTYEGGINLKPNVVGLFDGSNISAFQTY